MNFLSSYYDQHDGVNGQNCVSVSDVQGSAFAKEVAGDFNPIHDVGSKRFCVPGDLLFALALQHYGLHQKMEFKFLDLVNADASLFYPDVELESCQGLDSEPDLTKSGNQSAVADAAQESKLTVLNERGRPMLEVSFGGKCSKTTTQIESMIKRYVAFSGHNFPDILVPLMRQHDVMINPSRPLVIYQSMSFEFDHLDFKTVDITLGETSLEVDGKRGSAQLEFSLKNEDQEIGSGAKQLVMSGLREYDDQTVRQMCEDYLAGKQAKQTTG